MAFINFIEMEQKIPGPEKYGSKIVHISINLIPGDVPVNVATQGGLFIRHLLVGDVDCPEIGNNIVGELTHDDGQGNIDRTKVA